MTTQEVYQVEGPLSTAWPAYRPGPWLSLIAAPVLLIAPFVSAIAAGDWLHAAYVVLIGGVFGVAVTLPFGARRSPTVLTELVFVVLLLLCTGYLVLWQEGKALLFPLLAVAASLAIRPGAPSIQPASSGESSGLSRSSASRSAATAIDETDARTSASAKRRLNPPASAADRGTPHRARR